MEKQKNGPRHVAFIMDGNRRWARSNKLKALQGHTKGADIIRPLVEYCAEYGISYLTFWAFSTENWKRDEQEVEHLMNLFRSFITGDLMRDLMENGVKLTTIGDLSKFPEDIVRSIENVVDKSKNNTKITVIMALNYGGREEILHAIKSMQKSIGNSVSSTENVTEEEFEKYLYTAGVPDPDIIIRTGGEMRLSGHLPWQSVYSELFFTDTLWPDFTKDELGNILEEYKRRERRFGK